MTFMLPPELLKGSSLRGNEYGWKVAAFPDAIAKAEAAGYACVGGQFQMRLDDGSVCQMYWLNADARERDEGEPWSAYAHRSCSEVFRGFQRLMAYTDFRKEVVELRDELKAELERGLDVMSVLVFVAYFINEAEAGRLSARHSEHPTK
jgi:hypothetical protein